MLLCLYYTHCNLKVLSALNDISLYNLSLLIKDLPCSNIKKVAVLFYVLRTVQLSVLVTAIRDLQQESQSATLIMTFFFPVSATSVFLILSDDAHSQSQDKYTFLFPLHL